MTRPRPSRRRTAGSRARLVPLVLLGALLLSACSAFYDRPTVRVARVSLASLSLTGGGTVEVDLEVANPNGFDLETRGYEYVFAYPDTDPDGDTLWIPLVREDRERTVVLAAEDTTRLTLDVPFDLETVGRAAGRLLRDGALDYRFNGAVRLRTPVGGLEVPFDERGTLRP